MAAKSMTPSFSSRSIVLSSMLIWSSGVTSAVIAPFDASGSVLRQNGSSSWIETGVGLLSPITLNWLLGRSCARSDGDDGRRQCQTRQQTTKHANPLDRPRISGKRRSNLHATGWRQNQTFRPTSARTNEVGSPAAATKFAVLPVNCSKATPHVGRNLLRDLVAQPQPQLEARKAAAELDGRIVLRGDHRLEVGRGDQLLRQQRVVGCFEPRTHHTRLADTGHEIDMDAERGQPFETGEGTRCG